ncbi:MAG: hypothetical protein R2747_25085 [Pyrinomonadaceae bacterium]
MNIAVKILAFVVTAGIVGAVSVFLFGFMILLMNGYHESDARYGIFLFIIWAVVGSLVAGILGVSGVYFLADRRRFHPVAAGFISVGVFLIAGMVINILGVVAGIATAEVVRTQF